MTPTTKELTMHGLPVEVDDSMEGATTALMCDGDDGAVIRISPAMADLLDDPDERTRQICIAGLKIEDTRVTVAARLDALERHCFGGGR